MAAFTLLMAIAAWTWLVEPGRHECWFNLSSRTAGEAFGKGILINIAQWVLYSGAKVERAWACRRQALAKAFGERRIDPASEVAEELFEYFPDLKAKYGSPERGV
jgi:hypothetical protein